MVLIETVVCLVADQSAPETGAVWPSAWGEGRHGASAEHNSIQTDDETPFKAQTL